MYFFEIFVLAGEAKDEEVVRTKGDYACAVGGRCARPGGAGRVGCLSR